VAFIAWMTLNPAGRPPDEPLAPFFCILRCGNESLRDLVSNIILFVPLGWVLSYWTTPRRAFAICLVATVGIELTQALFLPARDPSFRDILTNAAGGAIGLWAYHNLERLVRPRESSSWRLGSAALVSAIAVIGITLAGLQPSPTARPWFGHWTPQLGGYDYYRGTLISVAAGGVRPPHGLLPPSEADPIRDALTREEFSVEVHAVSGTLPAGVAPIFMITDDARQEQVMIGQSYRTFRFQARTRFAAWELRDPGVRLPLFPGREPGDTITAIGRVEPGYWHLSVTSRAGADSVTLPLSAGLAWTTLVPSEFPVWDEWIVLNALWLALLFAPAGYWLGRIPGGRALLYGGATGALALLALPALVGGAPTQWSEWVGSASGFCFAAWLARRLRPPVTG
jgi:hypothetical protein